MLLAALLASASLQLTPQAPGLAELRLCFDPPTPAIRYELLVIAQGPAGRSQSRQRGMADEICPVRNSLHMPASTRVEAHLRWWVDEVEQEPVVTAISM
ncbi:hypothetical protein [Pseudomonas sp. TCU-HL1]|uniref:hypothetical protein n=1 Tax=Pseudomonas sp. TCU-HL1 TaxID=1856685 RepID=UPI00083D33AB|nr:hypothetical protein [Pseudomonas sp. TCU-HL1]AOE87536.1 hypothetical protein THL1_4988 [Pseudomonas sp. TCU-HL1]